MKNKRKNYCHCGRLKMSYSKQCYKCRLKEYNSMILGPKKKIQYLGKGNNRYGTYHTKETIKKITESNKKVIIVEHHKYLKENSDIKIKVSPHTHSLLHQKVYSYLYIKYGKEGIDNYIKWFNKNIRRLK